MVSLIWDISLTIEPIIEIMKKKVCNLYDILTTHLKNKKGTIKLHFKVGVK